MAKEGVKRTPRAAFNEPAILAMRTLPEVESAALDKPTKGAKASAAEITGSLTKRRDRLHGIVGAWADGKDARPSVGAAGGRGRRDAGRVSPGMRELGGEGGRAAEPAERRNPAGGSLRKWRAGGDQ